MQVKTPGRQPREAGSRDRAVHVEPVKPSASEKEAAEKVQRNLFGGMETPFDALLRERVRAVFFGVAVPEIE